MIRADLEIDYIEAYDAIAWLSELLDRHVRTATVPLIVRTFPHRGVQYRCANGPWADTLSEAIAAHKTKTVAAAPTTKERPC